GRDEVALGVEVAHPELGDLAAPSGGGRVVAGAAGGRVEERGEAGGDRLPLVEGCQVSLGAGLVPHPPRAAVEPPRRLGGPRGLGEIRRRRRRGWPGRHPGDRAPDGAEDPENNGVPHGAPPVAAVLPLDALVPSGRKQEQGPVPATGAVARN